MRYLALILVLLIIVGCSGQKTLNPDAVKKYASSNDINSSAHWLNSSVLAIPNDANAKFRFMIGFPDGLNGNTKPSIYQISPIVFERSQDIFLADNSELTNHSSYSINANRKDKELLLSGDVFIAGISRGNITSLSRVQMGGAIDDLYTADALAQPINLGASQTANSISFRVWAPTAKTMSVRLFDYQQVPIKEIPMIRGSDTGIWEVSLDRSDNILYYRYKLSVFHSASQKTESYEVTDPYSYSLSTTGEYSRITDLSSADLKPEGWDTHSRPQSGPTAEDILYRIDIAEYSKLDETVPAMDRSHFSAFGYPNSDSIKRLNDLRSAGVTTLNLMPISNGAERGTAKQHLLVPDEIYASTPEIKSLPLDLRNLVQVVHSKNLQVILDIPAANIGAIGIDKNSVLDKIVPGYYVLRDTVTGAPIKNGAVYRTDTRRQMVAKLIQDTQSFWSTHYQIDGFNFSQLDQWRSPSKDPNQSLTEYLQSGEPNKSINYIGDQTSRVFDDRTEIQVSSQVLLAPGIPLIQGPLKNEIRSTILDFMKIRSSSPLFQLANNEEVKARLHFPTTGNSVENLTVMTIDDGYSNETLADLDPNHSQIIVVFNPTKKTQRPHISNAGRLRLHPLQVNGSDPIVRRAQIALDQIIIPPQSTAVFVRPQ